jgi:hypothetical protein
VRLYARASSMLVRRGSVLVILDLPAMTWGLRKCCCLDGMMREAVLMAVPVK